MKNRIFAALCAIAAIAGSIKVYMYFGDVIQFTYNPPSVTNEIGYWISDFIKATRIFSGVVVLRAFLTRRGWLWTAIFSGILLFLSEAQPRVWANCGITTWALAAYMLLLLRMAISDLSKLGIDLGDLNGAEKQKANQAPEPTGSTGSQQASTAVTHSPAGKPPAASSRRSLAKADAGDRASGTRGST